MFSLKVANSVKLEAILFMLIRWSKHQNSAWEQGESNSAYPNYAKKSGSQLLLRNASRLLHRPLSRNGSSLCWVVIGQDSFVAVAEVALVASAVDEMALFLQRLINIMAVVVVVAEMTVAAAVADMALGGCAGLGCIGF